MWVHKEFIVFLIIENIFRLYNAIYIIKLDTVNHVRKTLIASVYKNIVIYIVMIKENAHLTGSLRYKDIN